MRDDDDDFDDGDDDEGDLDDDDEEMVACPYCQALIYEDSERCAECGSYLSRIDAPSRPAWWLVLGVVVCLIIVALWILRFA